LGFTIYEPHNKTDLKDKGEAVTKEEMKGRTKNYALRVIKAVQALPSDRVANVLGSQLLRAGTSVGANYRAVCRAKSTADFLNKLKIVEEECDESLFWMELLIESGTLTQRKLGELMKEGDEILAIIVAALKTTRLSSLSARKS
jgi:four helix bundle protein